MKQINLLPWRETRRKVQQRRFAMFAAGWTAFAVAVVFGGYLYVGELIEAQQARNAFLEKEIAQLDKSISSIKELKKEKQRLMARMEVIRELQSSRTAIVHMLDELARVVPGGVYFTALKQRGAVLEIEGVAQSNANVSDLMRHLDGAEWMGNPRLDVIESKGERSAARASRFVLRVNHVIAHEENKIEAS